MPTGNQVVLLVSADTNQANTALQGVANQINGLATNTGGVTNAVGGLDKSLMKVVGSVGGMVAGFAGLTGVVAITRQLVQANGEFDDTMQKVRAVTQTSSSFTEAAFQRMRKEALRLGETTQFTSAQAAEGLVQLGQAGFTADQAAESLAGTLMLAQAGSLDLASASNIVAGTLNAFGAATSETEAYANALAVMASRTNTDVTQMGEAFKYVGSIAGGLGQDVDEVAAAVGVLSNSNVKGSMAGTALRGVLIQLADTSSKAYRDLIDMGASADAINPQMNSIAGVMEELKRVGVDAGNAYSLFGQRAGLAADILSKRFGEVTELEMVVKSDPEALAKMSRTMEDSLPAAMARASSAWEALMISLGDTGLMDATRAAFEGIAVLLGKMASTVRMMTGAFQDGMGAEVVGLLLQVGFGNAVNWFNKALIASFAWVGSLIGSVLGTDLHKVAKWVGVTLVKGVAMMVEFLANRIAPIIEELPLAILRPLAPLISIGTSFVNVIWSGLLSAGQMLVGLIQKAVDSVSGFAAKVGIDMTGVHAGLATAQDWLTGEKKVADLRKSKDGANAIARDVVANTSKLGIASGRGLRNIGATAKAQSDVLGNPLDSFGQVLGASIDKANVAAVMRMKHSNDGIDISDAQSKLDIAFKKYVNPARDVVDGGKAKSKHGEGDATADSMDAGMGGDGTGTRSVAGSFASAINLIMGRSAQELIASESLKQTDLAEKQAATLSRIEQHLAKQGNQSLTFQ